MKLKTLILGFSLFIAAPSFSGSYIVWYDGTGDLQIMDLETGQQRDTRNKVPTNFKIAGNYVTFLDSTGDLQTLDLRNGQQKDTRTKVPANYRTSSQASD
jgi:hypothetical protein